MGGEIFVTSWRRRMKFRIFDSRFGGLSARSLETIGRCRATVIFESHLHAFQSKIENPNAVLLP